MKKYFTFLFIITTFFSFTQQSYYQDIFKGGVCITGIASADAIGSFDLPINLEPNSSIKKIFLIIYKQRYKSIKNFTYNVTINNIDFEFNEFTICGNFIKNGFINNPANTSGYEIHIKDITQSFSVLNTLINIKINNFSPPDECPACRPSSPMLVILYENNNLQTINYSLLLHSEEEKNINSLIINKTNPIDSNFDVGLGILTDRLGSQLVDGYNFYINSNLIGKLNQTDTPYNIAGVIGSYYYLNGILNGLTDDTPDNLINGSDGIMRLNNYLINSSVNGINLTLEYIPPLNSFLHNIFTGYNLTYTTPCDTFSVSTPKDTTICFGTQLQLNASGGNTSGSLPSYEWTPATGLSCTDCPNPVFTADSSMFYSIRIRNNDSCSVVRPLKINVEKPVLSTISIKPTDCGTNNGSIELAQNTGIGANIYSIQNSDSTLVDTLINNVAKGTYTFVLKSELGCTSDLITLDINEINQTNALFGLTPSSGNAPLEVEFFQLSSNASNYAWYINGEYLGENLPTNPYILENGGTYTIELLAWKYDPECADTDKRTIVVSQIIIPTAFTPNNDAANDTWEILKLNDFYPNNTVYIFNRWGELLYTRSKGTYSKEPWDGTFNGKPLPVGSYYYKIDPNDKKTEDLTGTVSIILK